MVGVSRKYRRTPFGFDGPGVTSRTLQEFLPRLMQRLERVYHTNPDLVIETWPKVVGEALAPMTRATSFVDGVLRVTVRTSTLLSVLSNPVDKQRIMAALCERLPGLVIENIVFKIG